MRVDEVLDGAADALDEIGWGQGNWLNPETGCMCLDGALEYAVTGDARAASDKASDAFMAIAEYMHARRDRFVLSSPVLWNDTPGRTKEEVTALLREVAAHVRSEG